MLQPIMHILECQRIVLASASPRRKQILGNIGLKFEVVPSTFEENLDKSTFKKPGDYALLTARHKAMEVASRLSNDQRPPDLVIGADTVVTMDGKIFEKPDDVAHAVRMLSGFSGRSHTVYTGVVLITPKTSSGKLDVKDESSFHIDQFCVGTDVQFASVSQEILQAYAETGESLDKAGGYGIQAAGGTLVEGVHGDYFNVMGFPLHKFSEKIYQMYQSKLLTAS